MATLTLPKLVVKRRSKFSTCKAATLEGLVVTHEVFLRIFHPTGGRKTYIHASATPHNEPKGTKP